ncbi:MAG: hypothetical protein JWP87_3309 [Labilithrix sp.]|nr:hypothetical protein [Labilithrix sp.]
MKRILPWLGLAAFLAGCSGGSSEEPDPTDPNATGSAVPGAPGTPGAPGAPSTEADPPAPASPGTTPGGGTTPPGSTPAPTPGATNAGAFTGAPPYVAMLGPSTIDTSGKGNGHLSFNAAGNPAGRACLDCHDGAGKGGAPAFALAGTIYTDAAGTKPAARVEIRMVGADGKALSAYTDVNGNFFVRTSAGTTKPPAIAAARNATVVKAMANKISDASCNQCHTTGSRITL